MAGRETHVSGGVRVDEDVDGGGRSGSLSAAASPSAAASRRCSRSGRVNRTAVMRPRRRGEAKAAVRLISVTGLFRLPRDRLLV
jgi:hypothetical protein